MWDEKQFFNDFIKESDEVQPSAEFVNKMKNLSEQSLQIDEKRKMKAPKVITGVLAAAAVVGILFMTGLGQGKEEMILEESQIYAEKEENSNTMEGSLSDIFSDKKLLLEDALTEGNVSVKDAQGKELTIEEKEVLLEQIIHAEETEISFQSLDDKKEVFYDVEGDLKIRFSIIEGEYLVIQEKVYSIQ